MRSTSHSTRPHKGRIGATETQRHRERKERGSTAAAALRNHVITTPSYFSSVGPDLSLLSLASRRSRPSLSVLCVSVSLWPLFIRCSRREIVRSRHAAGHRAPHGLRDHRPLRGGD